MGITNFLWRQLPDQCSMPHCSRLGVRGNENIVDGRLMCDQCHAIHLLRRSGANDYAATMERVEDALREYARMARFTSANGQYLYWGFVAVLAALQVYANFGPPPSSPETMAMTALFLYVTLAIGGMG
jgi:hypothetical protein